VAKDIAKYPFDPMNLQGLGFQIKSSACQSGGLWPDVSLFSLLFSYEAAFFLFES